MASPIPNHKDEEWHIWASPDWNDGYMADFSALATEPRPTELTEDSPRRDTLLGPKAEVLGSSEWMRVDLGDLALMAAAPIGYRMARAILHHKGPIGVPDLVADAEAFMKKIVESMDKLGTTVYNDVDPLGPEADEFAEMEK